MRKYTSILVQLVLIGLATTHASTGHRFGKSELQEYLRDHINERMYNVCKTVVLTQEADNIYRGYVEFLNGIRNDIEVDASREVIEYALTRSAPPPAALPRLDSLLTTRDELQATVSRQQAEIARLKALCRQAGVDPEPAPPAQAGEPSPIQAVARSEAMPFTRQMYAEIRKGMPYQKVRDVLGADGERIGNSRFGDEVNEMRVWINLDDSHICVVFQNGIVLVKTQSGLPGVGSAPRPPTSEND